MKTKYFIVFFVFLLLLELVIRIGGFAPTISKGKKLYQTDKYLPYMMKPNLSTFIELPNKEFAFLSKHNSAGLRDVEHSKNKPADAFRILGLGDSFTYGFGAQYEDTYLYKLEKMLNAKIGLQKRIEIIKAGIPASYPEIQRIFLEHYGLRYQPDLIIVGFLPNDVINTYTGIKYFKLASDGSLSVFNQSLFTKLIRELYLKSDLFRLLITPFYWKYSSNHFERWNDIYKENGFHEKNWRKLEDEYLKIKEISKTIGSKLVIVCIPEKKLPEGATDADHPSSRLSAWGKKNGVLVINTLPAFKEKGDMESFYWKDGHCNKKGYAIIAETIFAELIKKKLIN